ncbi:metallophosphoesterase family protein [Calycomorphotria hydatis]|uniref:Cyclic 3',5'-adenosine monophosphate phosphodiesterase n=1 Tax=Calycomorphotria hydatis TaxID=2528027 RepID=A0A517T752_9PLAN|nr:metallophosphoesterase [Calycomorphotria hydatis]QDT64206.1 cyclic 3',5'-adenosine monophosphate phosphodiesterase [Calycomorphotria hydatis]
MSDLHFGPPYVSRVGKSLLEFANEQALELIVVSGDLTEYATDTEFQQAADFLSQLPGAVPRVVIPGNHDVPQLQQPRIKDFRHPFRKYRNYINEQLDNHYEFDGLTVVALNSTSWWGSWINGWISDRQLDYCERAFADTPEEYLRLFVTHHHLAPAPDYDGGTVMRRAKTVVDKLHDCKVDIALGGHLHRSYIGNTLDFYPGEDRSQGVVIVQAGTATSRRGRAREKEKNSVNIIETDSDSIQIQNFMFFDQLGGFVPVSEHRYPRAGVTSLSSTSLACRP